MLGFADQQNNEITVANVHNFAHQGLGCNSVASDGHEQNEREQSAKMSHDLAPDSETNCDGRRTTTTRLLDRITQGKSGIARVSPSELMKMEEPAREARKAELRAAWRTWLEENKAEWEAEPKPEEEAPAQDSASPEEGRPADTQAE